MAHVVLIHSFIFNFVVSIFSKDVFRKGRLVSWSAFLFLAALLFFAFSAISIADDLKNSPDTKKGLKEASNGVKEVTVEGLAIIGADTTKSEARIMALNNARRNAIEEASGVYVGSSTLVSDYKIIFDLIKASSRGLIVKEEILDENERLIKDKTPEGKIVIHETYLIKLKALVKPIVHSREIKITKLTLHKAGVDEPLNLPVFTNNEEAQIRVSVNKDSYIHIFSISQDGAVTKLLPSQYFPPIFLKKGEDLIFPADAQRELGLRLRVKTPEGSRKAVESLVVIATKGGDEEFLHDVKLPNLIDLWQELSQIEASAWADEMVGYEIRK